MRERALIDRLLSPAGFGLVLIFFLMPFFTVSCGTEPKTEIKSTFSGVALATGAQPKVENNTPEQAAKLLSAFPNSFYPEVFVVLAALAVVAGLVVGFLRASAVRHGASLSLAVIAVGLLVLEIRHAPTRVVDALATLYNPDNPGPPLLWSVQPRYGFWFAVGLLVLLAGYHASMLLQKARELSTSAVGPPPSTVDYAPWPT
jgi:hypothetical protein